MKNSNMPSTNSENSVFVSMGIEKAGIGAKNHKKDELTPWQVDQSQPYFYYDAEDCGFAYFSTEKERDEKANEAIKGYLDNDGWYEEVTGVVCGTLTGRATMVDVTPVEDDITDTAMKFYKDDQCDYTCNYAIKPLDHVEPVK